VREARRLGFDRTRSLSLVYLADEALRCGRLEPADAAIQEGLSLARGRILVHEAQLTSLAGRLQRRQGRLGEAVTASRQAIALTEQLGLKAQHALQHLLNAELWLDLHAFDTAKQDLLAAQTLVPASLKAYSTQLETLLARLDLETGQVEAALERLLATASAAQHAAPEQRARHTGTLARAQLQHGQPAAASATLMQLQAPALLGPWLAAIQLEARTITSNAAEAMLEPATPLEALALHRALGQTERERALRHELAATLEAEPALQHSFLE
jgi:hypothetical protein